MAQQELSCFPSSTQGHSPLQSPTGITVQIIDESLVEYLWHRENERVQQSRKGTGRCLIHNHSVSAQTKVKYVQRHINVGRMLEWIKIEKHLEPNVSMRPISYIFPYADISNTDPFFSSNRQYSSKKMRCPSCIFIIDHTKIKKMYKYFQHTHFALRRKLAHCKLRKKKKSTLIPTSNLWPLTTLNPRITWIIIRLLAGVLGLNLKNLRNYFINYFPRISSLSLTTDSEFWELSIITWKLTGHKCQESC